MEDLPIYNVSINPDLQKGENELGMDEVAFTSDPAILVKGVAFKNQSKKLFADDKKYRITAPAMIPMDIYRADEDGEYMVRFTEQTIEAIHVKFMSNLKNHDLFNVEHESELRAPAYILEAWIVDNPKQDKAFSSFGLEVPKGTLMLTAQITDKNFYEEIVKQERFGFSIEAFLALQAPTQKEETIKQNKMELPNGKFSLDGKEYEVIDGQITEVQLSEEVESNSTNEEVVAEAPVVEAVAEVAMEDQEEESEEVEAMEEPKEEEMAEEVVEEPQAEEAPMVSQAEFEEFKQEVLQIIAGLTNEMEESAEEAPAEDAEVNMSASVKLEQVHKFLRNG